MRILLSALLVTAAFAALTPSASASCIDTSPDDNGIGTTGCNVPVAGDCHVLVYGSLPGIGSGCSPIVCIRECVPYDCVQDCDGTEAAAASLCTTEGNPALDAGFGVTCAYGPAECSAATATFGTLDAFLAPDAGCDVDVALCTLGPQVDDGDVERFLLQCDGMIQCVTEPCPGSGGIKV